MEKSFDFWFGVTKGHWAVVLQGKLSHLCCVAVGAAGITGETSSPKCGYSLEVHRAPLIDGQNAHSMCVPHGPQLYGLQNNGKTPFVELVSDLGYSFIGTNLEITVILAEVVL